MTVFSRSCSCSWRTSAFCCCWCCVFSARTPFRYRLRRCLLELEFLRVGVVSKFVGLGVVVEVGGKAGEVPTMSMGSYSSNESELVFEGLPGSVWYSVVQLPSVGVEGDEEDGLGGGCFWGSPVVRRLRPCEERAYGSWKGWVEGDDECCFIPAGSRASLLRIWRAPSLRCCPMRTASS